MTDVVLTFYERISLWSMIGNYQAPRLADVAILLRVLDKVRPADFETREAAFAVADGQMSWRLPNPEYGQRAVELEDEEAAALLKVFESLQGVRVSDGEWICRLMERLQPATPAAVNGNALRGV